MGGIWIRSQDKSLYYCKGFDKRVDKNKAYAIVGHVSDEMHPILGWYETETQALQVLDEIWAYIASGTWHKGVVYVMPE
jgi:hypothetical protein